LSDDNSDKARDDFLLFYFLNFFYFVMCALLIALWLLACSAASKRKLGLVFVGDHKINNQIIKTIADKGAFVIALGTDYMNGNRYIMNAMLE